MPKSPAARFSDRADVYDAHRPSYPDAAIDAMLAGLGDAGELTIADIGAGTGIASRLLAARGARVLAIEPNDQMRVRGESQACGGIKWSDASGEATGLRAGSIDLVVCAQAFHWMDEERALQEFGRILRRSGRAALIWNIQSASDAFTSAYRELLHTHAVDPPRSPSYAKAPPRPFEAREEWADTRVMHFEYEQVLDETGLIGRALSSSYCPNEGADRDQVVEGLSTIFAQFERDGFVRLRYDTELQLASRA